MLGVDLSNPDMTLPSGVKLLRGTLHVYRTKFLSDGVCFERFAVQNFGQQPIDAEISLSVAADFADIFEVRGQKRGRRGARLPAETEPSAAVLRYQGLDGILRCTRIECTAPDSHVGGSL